jgi:hypothetical protein
MILSPHNIPKGYFVSFILCVILAMLLQLSMLDGDPGRLPSPDLVFIVCFMFRFRLGSAIGLFPIFITLLFSDLIFDYLPGLRTAIYFVILEFLLKRQKEFISLGFLAEWGIFSTSVTVAFIVIWTIALESPHSLYGLKALIVTILTYPVVWYGIIFVIFRKRKTNAS